ncbi:MAG: ATP-binding protein [Caldimonas sp.]
MTRSEGVARGASEAMRMLLWMLAVALVGPVAAQTQNHQVREALRVGGDGIAKTVTLPEYIERRAGDPEKLTATYRLRADLGSRPGPTAVYLPGVFAAARIAVNGHVIADRIEEFHLARLGGAGRLVLATVPREFLHAGVNEVELKLASRQGIGLSAVWVGDENTLRAMHEHKLLWQVNGPAAGAGVVLVLSLCVLVIWARRPTHTLYGYFGIGGTIWALHTLWRLMPEPFLEPPHLGIWRNLGYGFFAVPLVIFCLRLSEWQLPRFEKAMWWSLLLSPPVLYVAQYAGVLGSTASYVRLLWIGAVAVGVYAVGLYALRRRDAQGVLLLATGFVALAFGVRDWLADQNPTDNNPIFLTSFAGVLFFPLVAWILIDGFVQAARDLERLNAELEQRVADKSAQLRHALENMSAAKEAAEGANRAKSAFLAAASHDLRQPTHALGLYMAALRAEKDAVPRAELADRMSEAIAALNTMFNALLDVSRMDAGALQVDVRPFAIAPLMHRLARELSRQAQDRGLRLSVRVSTNSQRLNALSDPVLVERILRNLLGNAVKYTQAGGVLLACRWRHGEGDGSWQVEIWDTGPGIPAADRERVFEEFFQLGNSERDRTGGMGLGLSIVRRMARLLGHRLRLDSIEGKGSRFVLELPATAEPARAALEIGASGSLAGLRVGIVDDDPEVREAARALLAGWKCKVVCAADVDELLARTDADPAVHLQALIVDYELRDGRNGIEAIEAVRRACGKAVPALVVSGAAAPDRLLELQASGHPWMIKPVPASRLRSWLVQAMSSHPPGPGGVASRQDRDASEGNHLERATP